MIENAKNWKTFLGHVRHFGHAHNWPVGVIAWGSVGMVIMIILLVIVVSNGSADVDDNDDNNGQWMMWGCGW